MQAFLLYIDPGSGSLILQILAGGALAAGMFVKTYWLRIKSFFKKSDNSSHNTPK
ncbi:MAG: hypothetical protein JWP27_442 [Flaviaesturariibacter sp.]|nr:hypothetical protein [Flaviaesturariibacter sp.]